MVSPELLRELTEGLVRKEDAKQRWAKLEVEAHEAKARASAAKKEYDAVRNEVEEIEAEIRTGLTGMPLVDAARARDAGPDDSPEPDEDEDEEMERFVYGAVGPPRRPVPTTKADEARIKPAKGSTRGSAARAVAP